MSKRKNECPLFEYFKIDSDDEQKKECIINDCGKVISKDYSSLRFHLQRNHLREWAEVQEKRDKKRPRASDGKERKLRFSDSRISCFGNRFDSDAVQDDDNMIDDEYDSPENCDLEVINTEPKVLISHKTSKHHKKSFQQCKSNPIKEDEMKLSNEIKRQTIMKNEKELVIMDLQEQKLRLEIEKLQNNEEPRHCCNCMRSSLSK